MPLHERLGAGVSIVVRAARLFERHRTAIRPFEYSAALVTEGVRTRFGEDYAAYCRKVRRWL